jgi:hypothetical protein
MSVTMRAGSARRISLPDVRGPWTEALYCILRGQAADHPDLPRLPPGDVLCDHDAQLALYLCYELHYSEVEGVDPRLEWSPAILALRGALEHEFEAALREDDGPPLSRFIERQGEVEHLLEHVVHRSAYQLKEADPHSWAIPRLTGAPKAALVEIQADEYGGGRPDRIHAALFANTMDGLGLDSRYGAYLEWLPGITLATVNLMSLCGLHRRLRGAIAGHLAVFEMTSSIPNRRYANGARRLGFGPRVTDFYDEHVEADAVHESIAAWDLANALARAEPEIASDILFGARALLALEARWAEHLLSSWRRGETSLLRPLDRAASR